MSDGAASRFKGVHHRGDEPHLIREVIRTYQVLMAGFSREIGMPASRLALMRLLAFADADVGVMDLARQLGVNAAAVTRQVQEMEAERLIRRHPDPKDGRRSYVRLSPRGRTLFEGIHDRSHALERSLSSVIGVEEIAAATTVLVKLRTFVEGLHRGHTGVEP
jgi:DNA-binding MarR family transcriptional regulator